jgi:BirA family biotin operon repressor/biotin-[acetyl-CoA-carboxylase] ligase
MKSQPIIRRFAAVPSTNDVARELAREGAAQGTVVVAEAQTRGRGTKGRSWHSPLGLGLYASFILRPDDSPSARSLFPLLPLIVGLAASDAIFDAAGVRAKLKWPNDLVSGKRKLGGILVESATRGEIPKFAVAGIGINVNHEESDFPEELKGTATSLRVITGHPVDKERLLEHLCRSLESWYNSPTRGRVSVIKVFEDRMAFSPGDRIRLQTHRQGLSGIYRGLTPEGGLLVEQDDMAVSVSFEEIQSLDWE